MKNLGVSITGSQRPHLKNNIKFEIYDLENMKPPTLKALIAEIMMVEFFEIWCIVMYCKLPNILEAIFLP